MYSVSLFRLKDWITQREYTMMVYTLLQDTSQKMQECIMLALRLNLMFFLKYCDQILVLKKIWARRQLMQMDPT